MGNPNPENMIDRAAEASSTTVAEQPAPFSSLPNVGSTMRVSPLKEETSTAMNLTDEMVSIKVIVPISGKWVILGVDDMRFLVFQDMSGKTQISPPLFRFNSPATASTRRDHKDRSKAWAAGNIVYCMTSPCDASSWFTDFWAKYWAPLGLTAEATVIRQSFYDNEIGRNHMRPRVHTPKTPPVDMKVGRRLYNVAHMRIRSGIRGVPHPITGEDHGAMIDNMLGMEYNNQNPYTPKKHMGIFPRGGVTIVYVLDRRSDQEDVVFVTYGMAICNFNDRYDRRRGLESALKRLNENLADPDPSSEKDPMTIRRHIDGRGQVVKFTGQGRTVVTMHPDSVFEMQESFALKSPFFPRGKVLNTLLLYHAIECMQAQTHFRGLTNIMDVLEAADFTATNELGQVGIEPVDYTSILMLDPKTPFQPRASKFELVGMDLSSVAGGDLSAVSLPNLVQKVDESAGAVLGELNKLRNSSSPEMRKILDGLENGVKDMLNLTKSDLPDLGGASPS